MPLDPITPTTPMIPMRFPPTDPLGRGNELADGIEGMFQEEEARQRVLNERQRRLEDAVASSLGFLNHIESIAGMHHRGNLEERGIEQEGRGNRTRYLTPHPEREEASGGITSIIKAIFFGMTALFLYSSAEEAKEIEDNIRTLNDDKATWDPLFLSFFKPPYHNRVKRLFQKAIVFLEEKEKSLLANYYFRVTLLASAITTGLSIGLKAHPFYQITAAVICATTSFFVIKRYAQGSYFEEARLSVELKNQVEEAERDLRDNLLSMEAISAIFDS